MNRIVPITAILLCNSALASLPEEGDGHYGSVARAGPQTVKVESNGATRVTVGEARVGSEGPEYTLLKVESRQGVGHTQPVEAKGLFGEKMAGSTRPKHDLRQTSNANPLEAKGLFGESSSKVQGPKNVTAVGLRGVDLTGVKTVEVPAVRAVGYSFKFGQPAASKPETIPSTAIGTMHVQPKLKKTDEAVEAIGFDGKVPDGTEKLVINGPVTAVGKEYIGGQNSDESTE